MRVPGNKEQPLTQLLAPFFPLTHTILPPPPNTPQDRDLPVSSVGDLFVIHDTGAHSHSMGFQYNGKLRAPELLLRESGGVDVIRTRETIPVLYSNAIMPQDLAATLPKSYPYLGAASISGGPGFLPSFKLWHAALGLTAFAAGSLAVVVAGRSRK